jgi:hypothetical protein
MKEERKWKRKPLWLFVFAAGTCTPSGIQLEHSRGTAYRNSSFRMISDDKYVDTMPVMARAVGTLATPTRLAVRILRSEACRWDSALWSREVAATRLDVKTSEPECGEM